MSLFIKLNPPKSFKPTPIPEGLLDILERMDVDTCNLNTFYLGVINKWLQGNHHSIKHLMGELRFNNSEESYIVNMLLAINNVVGKSKPGP